MCCDHVNMNYMLGMMFNLLYVYEINPINLTNDYASLSLNGSNVG
jgi:hypothetical protein